MYFDRRRRNSSFCLANALFSSINFARAVKVELKMKKFLILFVSFRFVRLTDISVNLREARPTNVRVVRQLNSNILPNVQRPSNRHVRQELQLDTPLETNF